MAIAWVTKVYECPVREGKKRIDVTYLAPAALRMDVNTGHSSEDRWPEDWAQHKLVPWKTPSGRRGLIPWCDVGIEMTAVCWSCNITKSRVVYKKQQPTLYQQWARLIESLAPGRRGTPSTFAIPPEAQQLDTKDDTDDDEDLLNP